jgi:hypothetical protein
MIIPKTCLVATVALTGLLFAPAAQAKDHGRHHGDRHDGRHHDYGYYGQSYNGYDQGYYYNQGPAVVYGDPYYNNDRYYGDRYYGRSNVGVTFAFGGHRHHRH